MDYKCIKLRKSVIPQIGDIQFGKTVYMGNKPQSRRLRETVQKKFYYRFLFIKKFGKIRMFLSKLFGFGEMYMEMSNESDRVSILPDSKYSNEIRWLQKKK